MRRKLLKHLCDAHSLLIAKYNRFESGEIEFNVFACLWIFSHNNDEINWHFKKINGKDARLLKFVWRKFSTGDGRKGYERMKIHNPNHICIEGEYYLRIHRSKLAGIIKNNPNAILRFDQPIMD